MRQARERLAAARAKIDSGVSGGLGVELGSIDPNYVRPIQAAGIGTLRFDALSIRQAIVMAELLGAPLALRDPEKTAMSGPLGINT